MSATAFAAALEGMGIRCQVQEQGKLAVITLLPPVPDPEFTLSEAEGLALGMPARPAIVALGRAHGFTNICIELRRADAPLSGD